MMIIIDHPHQHLPKRHGSILRITSIMVLIIINIITIISPKDVVMPKRHDNILGIISTIIGIIGIIRILGIVISIGITTSIISRACQSVSRRAEQ